MKNALTTDLRIVRLAQQNARRHATLMHKVAALITKPQTAQGMVGNASSTTNDSVLLRARILQDKAMMRQDEHAAAALPSLMVVPTASHSSITKPMPLEQSMKLKSTQPLVMVQRSAGAMPKFAHASRAAFLHRAIMKAIKTLKDQATVTPGPNRTNATHGMKPANGTHAIKTQGSTHGDAPQVPFKLRRVKWSKVRSAETRASRLGKIAAAYRAKANALNKRLMNAAKIAGKEISIKKGASAARWEHVKQMKHTANAQAKVHAATVHALHAIRNAALQRAELHHARVGLNTTKKQTWAMKNAEIEIVRMKVQLQHMIHHLSKAKAAAKQGVEAWDIAQQEAAAAQAAAGCMLVDQHTMCHQWQRGCDEGGGRWLWMQLHCPATCETTCLDFVLLTQQQHRQTREAQKKATEAKLMACKQYARLNEDYKTTLRKYMARIIAYERLCKKGAIEACLQASVYRRNAKKFSGIHVAFKAKHNSLACDTA